METSKVKEELELLTMRLEEKEQEKQKLLNEGLHKSGELRQVIEQQYLEKINKETKEKSNNLKVIYFFNFPPPY